MKKLYPDLYQTSLEQPFGGVSTHAYFLTRDEGNVLFYNPSNDTDIEAIAAHGGIDFQYLCHRHEAVDSVSTIKSRFNSQLAADNNEASFINRYCQVDSVFTQDVRHSHTIEILSTLGHTAGGLCFLYHSPYGLRYLFTGDLIFLSHGEWQTLLISSDGANSQKLINSLLKLRDRLPDVVFSCASVAEPSYLNVTEETWHQAIDQNIEALR